MKKLEKEIISWIAEKTDNDALSAQVVSAEVIRRDYMRTGFFIYFKVPEGLEAAAQTLRPICPYIDSPSLMDGGGCTLFMQNGFLHYLEIYARGGFFPKTLEQFQLRQVD
ncbi:MAG: hypothetical protein GY727_07315 [Gammaproteobacteria bacterium]|nr:hypothetical protein [Gammaproteobacteria bacterium]MCP4091681.1 hypothetical protein [Gammaproteobacteria bacterium]MCP4831811.1 hypothetical protein [Gammaproteobacteria bacterium]MCP4929747.1 hypothetical protein [Gammaproteobacteria bacterium]